MMTRDTFLAMTDKTVFCHVPVGTVFQLDGASPQFLCCVHALLDREFTDCWVGIGEPIPWPPYFIDMTPLDVLFWVC